MSDQPAIAINGVDTWIAYEEMGDNAVVESFPREGPNATVMFKCDWSRRYDLIRGLVGGVIAAGRSVVRTAPYRYPDNPNLLCWDIGDLRGLGCKFQVSGWPTYDQVIVPARFRTPTWDFGALDYGGQNDPSGQAWTTTRFRVSAEVFSPPEETYYIGPFPGGKLTEASGTGLMVPRVEISMTRHFMPFVPLEEVMDAIGTVNDADVFFANRTFPRGQLLFAGVNTDPSNDPQGNRCQEIEYTFLGNHSHEWNEFMGPDGDYHFLNTKADGTGEFPFVYSAFGDLP